jgi:hypothetical protein
MIEIFLDVDEQVLFLEPELFYGDLFFLKIQTIRCFELLIFFAPLCAVV